MKTLSVKVLAATCCIGLSSLAAAAPVQPDRILDFSSQDTYLVTTGSGNNLINYQVITASGQRFLNIDLLSSSNKPDTSSGYRLWEDSNSATDKITFGDELQGRTVIDLLGAISWAVEGGKQYILRINPLGGPDVTATSSVSAVPLPGALWLFGSALLGFLGLSNRRKF